MVQKKGEEKKVVEKTPEQLKKEAAEQKKLQNEMAARARAQQKAARDSLDAYKKRLRESVEIKRLQVEEIELNIRLFEAERKYDSMEPEMKAYAEAKEEKEAQEQARRLQEQQKKKSNIEVVKEMPTELKTERK